MSDMIRDFFKMESAGGILLVIAAAIGYGHCQFSNG